MPKVTSFKGQGSLGLGQGAAAKEPARPVHPTHTWPDTVDPRDERNRGQQLKSGLNSNKGVQPNPGRKG